MSIPSPDPHPLEDNIYVQTACFGWAGFMIGVFVAIAFGHIVFWLPDRWLFACGLIGAAVGIAIGYRTVGKLKN